MPDVHPRSLRELRRRYKLTGEEVAGAMSLTLTTLMELEKAHAGRRHRGIPRDFVRRYLETVEALEEQRHRRFAEDLGRLRGAWVDE